MRKKKVFIAAPTSNVAEQYFIQGLFRQLYRATVDFDAENVEIVYSSICFHPYEIAEGVNFQQVFSRVMGELEEIDLVVLCGDGVQVHDGSAFFAGAAWAKDIPVWLLRTDARRSGETDVEQSWIHPYIQGGVAATFMTVEALLEYFGIWLEDQKPVVQEPEVIDIPLQQWPPVELDPGVTDIIIVNLDTLKIMSLPEYIQDTCAASL